jgi:hypothetical protein
MSGRRQGRPTKGGDELTPREADTLACVEASQDGINANQIAAMLGVKPASVKTWLDELRRRDLAHAYLPAGCSSQTLRLWVAGPSHTGPVLDPMWCRAVPSIFHAGQACTSAA